MTKIVRYVSYPEYSPKYICVGFHTQFDTRSLYKEIQIPISETYGKTEEEITQIAREQIIQEIDDWITYCINNPITIENKSNTDNTQNIIPIFLRNKFDDR